MSESLAVVTIDGPSGVGKSSVSRLVASHLGFTYLDTGAMYRAVAYHCRLNRVEADDAVEIGRLLHGFDLLLLPAPSLSEEVQVVLNGQDISLALRTPEISMLASQVSALPVVRQKLTLMQQEMGAVGKIVAEGRDTGTVVFPAAAWKFFLDADPKVRADRRVQQLQQKGVEVDPEKILIETIKRDKDDSERAIAPLRAADDAQRIDTTNLSIDQVVAEMVTRVEGKPLK